jgi:hypothetical protein
MHARRFFFDDGANSYPVATATEMTTTGLVLCPIAVSMTVGGGPAADWYSELYRIAYTEAVATARSIRFERLRQFWPN